MRTTRRHFLTTFLALPAFAPHALAQDDPPARLELTPSCGEPTPRQTEGPYFTPNTPLKRDFAADAPEGQRITVAGYVQTQDCKPVPEALVELWHADDEGEYDNEGFRLRGHQFTDSQGRWWFDTIVPGIYSGRTRHYHVKVQRPGGEVLTTQLYFPGEPRNDRDGIFDPALLLDIAEAPDGAYARFDFVVA